jgi:hypothetical protein
MEVMKIYVGVIFTYFRNTVFPMQLESKKILSTVTAQATTNRTVTALAITNRTVIALAITNRTVTALATTNRNRPKNGYRCTSNFKIGTEYFFKLI